MGVLKFEDNAFHNCSSLTKMALSNSVKFIVYKAFCGRKHLTSIVLGTCLTNIYDDAFDGCNKLVEIVNK